MADKPDLGNPWAGVEVGWAITSYILASIGVCGGLGYLLDRLAGTTKVFMAIGMVLGVVLGTYLIYIHYGKEEKS
jgi:F0F1-type ATP synthase assembly protein I